MGGKQTVFSNISFFQNNHRIVDVSRVDLVFSYWIFIWYLFFVFHVFTEVNPKFALTVALFVNVVTLAYMVHCRVSWYHLFLFTIINICIKVIPLYTLRFTQVKRNDIIATFFLFGLHNIWLWLNHQTIFQNMHSTFVALTTDKIATPGEILLNKLTNHFLF